MAFVLSGGASLGAIQVGMLRALAQRGIEGLRAAQEEALRAAEESTAPAQEHASR